MGLGLVLLWANLAWAEEKTVLLIHSDGNLDNSSTYSHGVSAYGNTYVASGQGDSKRSDSEFGNAISFDGSGDYLSIPDSPDFDLGSGDYTIDFWFRLSSLPPSDTHKRTFINSDDVSGARGGYGVELINNSGAYIIGICGYASGFELWYFMPSAPSLNTWYHFAAVRSGNITRLYLDGQEVASKTSSYTFVDVSHTLKIGTHPYYMSGGGNYQQYMDGYMDEIRISKGIARTTDPLDQMYISAGQTAFSLPASPHPNTDPTIPAAITQFSSSASIIQNGTSTTLTWQTTAAVSCSFDQGIVIEAPNTCESGSLNVSPTQNTTYILTATGVGGDVVTQSIIVEIAESQTVDQLTTFGTVGIGTSIIPEETDSTKPATMLAVNGTIVARRIKVTDVGWADYVFDDKYNLKPLKEVAAYIEENKHLPELPSAREVEDQGLSVSDMFSLQMQKIEELTLYLIDLEKKNEELQNRLNSIEAQSK